MLLIKQLHVALALLSGCSGGVAGPAQGFLHLRDSDLEILRPWVPVVSLSKGLEMGTKKRMTEVAEEELPEPIRALASSGGPGLVAFAAAIRPARKRS